MSSPNPNQQPVPPPGGPTNIGSYEDVERYLQEPQEGVLQRDPNDPTQGYIAAPDSTMENIDLSQIPQGHPLYTPEQQNFPNVRQPGLERTAPMPDPNASGQNGGGGEGETDVDAKLDRYEQQILNARNADPYDMDAIQRMRRVPVSTHEEYMRVLDSGDGIPVGIGEEFEPPQMPEWNFQPTDTSGMEEAIQGQADAAVEANNARAQAAQMQFQQARMNTIAQMGPELLRAMYPGNYGSNLPREQQQMERAQQQAVAAGGEAQARNARAQGQADFQQQQLQYEAAQRDRQREMQSMRYNTRRKIDKHLAKTEGMRRLAQQTMQHRQMVMEAERANRQNRAQVQGDIAMMKYKRALAAKKAQQEQQQQQSVLGRMGGVGIQAADLFTQARDRFEKAREEEAKDWFMFGGGDPEVPRRNVVNLMGQIGELSRQMYSDLQADIKEGNVNQADVKNRIANAQALSRVANTSPGEDATDEEMQRWFENNKDIMERFIPGAGPKNLGRQTTSGSSGGGTGSPEQEYQAYTNSLSQMRPDDPGMVDEYNRMHRRRYQTARDGTNQ